MKNSKFIPIFTLCMILLFAAVFTGVIFGAKRFVKNREPVSDAELPSAELSGEKVSIAEPVSEEESSSALTLEETISDLLHAELPTEVSPGGAFTYKVVGYPAKDAEAEWKAWELICLNTNYRVPPVVDTVIELSYVAGSSERMEKHAAQWYDKMYNAAAAEGIYLTPCSGYRSYTRQELLFGEFVNEYIAQGYNTADAERQAATRRMPAGSSEHNVGICMDIILADSSMHFENYPEYAWLQAHAQDYGFILRYPEDKVDITGVKFEPWHWRYVGVENAPLIKASGLCLEEYLGQVPTQPGTVG